MPYPRTSRQRAARRTCAAGTRRWPVPPCRFRSIRAATGSASDAPDSAPCGARPATREVAASGRVGDRARRRPGARERHAMRCQRIDGDRRVRRGASAAVDGGERQCGAALERSRPASTSRAASTRHGCASKRGIASRGMARRPMPRARADDRPRRRAGPGCGDDTDTQRPRRVVHAVSACGARTVAPHRVSRSPIMRAVVDTDRRAAGAASGNRR